MIRAKKHLGQHFLNDENIAERITESISLQCPNLLEIGPGTGVLTKYLLNKISHQEDASQDHIQKFIALDVDRESITYLKQNYPKHAGSFIEADFIRINPSEYFNGCFTIIGNFPYNISSQIFFQILEHHDQVPEVVCMLQKEVAERIASPPGNKSYGILSVLLQAWYDIEYLFTVDEHVFIPPPKVKSAVIRLKRNQSTDLGCDQVLFKTIVKTAFNQRRKTLRNALKGMNLKFAPQAEYLMNKRAEQLGVAEFVLLTNASGS